MARSLLLALLASAALLAAARPAHAQPGGCAQWKVDSDEATNIGNNHTILVKDVQIDCNDIQLFADHAEVFTDIDRLLATGNVVFVSGTSRISAERMEFNTRTKTGTFFTASGTINMEARGIDASFFGGGDPAAYFYGETVEKLGPDRYRITHGGFTTCVQPTPRWELVTGSTTLIVDKRAILRNSVLKVKDVPVFYLPYMYYPINRENRSTGFLMPTYGNSTIRGRTLNNAFFWAINRSQDATIYHDWYSNTGQSLGGEYRYVRTPGSGEMKAYLLNEHTTIYEQPDGSRVIYPGARNYQVTGLATERINSHLRATFDANYFSSLIVQQRYQQDIYNATNRSRSIRGNVQGNWGPHTISVTTDRSETLNNEISSSVYGSTPRVTLARGEKSIPGIPLYYGASFEYASLIRQEIAGPITVDRGLTRMNFAPTIRFPFTHWSFLTFNTSASWHETYWTESLVNNAQVEEPVSRRYYDLATRISGPTFSRIWTRTGSGGTQKFKHVIEPSVSVRRTSSFENYDKIVKLDGTDYNVGGFTRVNYGVASRLYAKREQAREVLTFSLDQSYYTDENASRYDAGYSSSYLYGKPSSFSPLTYQVRVSPTPLIDGTMVAEYDTSLDVLQLFNVNGGVAVGPFLRASGGWSHRKNEQYAANNPNRTDNFLQAAAQMSTGLPAALKGYYQFNYDLKRKVFVQQRLSVAYNTQCCGIAAEFQSFNYATGGLIIGVPKDRRFNLSFTLAGIGSFSNLFGSFGGQQGR